MFQLHSIVRLKEDNEEYGVPATAIGAIVDVHALNGANVYTVEFIDENGDTYEDALFTDFNEDELESVEE